MKVYNKKETLFREQLKKTNAVVKSFDSLALDYSLCYRKIHYASWEDNCIKITWSEGKYQNVKSRLGDFEPKAQQEIIRQIFWKACCDIQATFNYNKHLFVNE